MEKQVKVHQGLSGSTLKLIAMLCMLVDHFGSVIVYRVIILKRFLPENYENWYLFYKILRVIGRTAFPIFCFLLVEGFLHTRNKGKYAVNLFLFALISEIPFDLGIYGNLNASSQNVFFTLLIGLLVIIAMDKINVKSENKSSAVSFVCSVVIFLSGCLAATILSTDYGYNGVVLIVIFYLFRYNRVAAGIIGFISFIWEYFCFPAFLIIQCYNGKRGLKNKYFFYFFYPLHLLILYIISIALGLIST